MPSRDTFSSCHPVVGFLYFALVLLLTMFCMHPAVLGISLAGSLWYAISLNGRRAVKFSLVFLLPLILLAVVVNPAFNHQGITVLAYLPTGNPLTLESILYGFSAGGMLAAVLCWFSCYNVVMTSDKFVYLFGRVIPALSLVLSMTLRFVPKCKQQLQRIAQAQRGMGRDPSTGSLLHRLREGVTILSILITWSLENAIETADSMKGRGYGLPGRTAFSLYRLDWRDRAVLLWLCFCGGFLVSGALAGGFFWRYYPSVRGVTLTPLTAALFLCWLALCFTPAAMDQYAHQHWKKLYGNGNPGDSPDTQETPAGTPAGKEAGPL